jgi:hypothetical protein
MKNGIRRDLNNLLSFALSLDGYVENASSWKLARSITTADNLLKDVSPTLSLTADVVVPDRSFSLAFSLRAQPLCYPPQVKSSAQWLRRNIDWHVFDDGTLCWAYPQHYFELMRALSNYLDETELLQTAACWCVSKSAELAQRHLIAEECALKTWPQEWEAWPHGIEAAQTQFNEMKRRGKFDAEIRHLLAARKA